MKEIYTQGSFDLFHRGHVKLLKSCATLGEVTVSLLSDHAYETYRGYAPAIPFVDRKAVLESCRYVKHVFEGDNTKTAEELERIKPDIVVVGSDWAKKDIYKQWGVSQEWLDEREILLVYFPYTEGISSTDIKKRLCTS